MYAFPTPPTPLLSRLCNGVMCVQVRNASMYMRTYVCTYVCTYIHTYVCMPVFWEVVSRGQECSHLMMYARERVWQMLYVLWSSYCPKLRNPYERIIRSYIFLTRNSVSCKKGLILIRFWFSYKKIKSYCVIHKIEEVSYKKSVFLCYTIRSYVVLVRNWVCSKKCLLLVRLWLSYTLFLQETDFLVRKGSLL